MIRHDRRVRRGSDPGAVRIAAALVLFASAAFADDVNALAVRLKAADPLERARAACEVEQLNEPASALIPQLASMLADSAAVPGDVCGNWGRWARDHQIPDTTPGERAAAALASIGTASFEPLVQALERAQWHARKNAAWALGALDDPRAVQPLVAALEDSEPPVRRNAAWALGALDSDAAAGALIDALKDTDADTRAQAAWALGAIGDERAAEGLAATLSDGDAHVRSQAAWALGAIDGATAVPALMRAVRLDGDARVRSQAAWALGAIGDRRAADALAAALKDPDVKVRRQAAWALGAITKTP